MHFWRNLPAALICAAKGAYGQPKSIFWMMLKWLDTHPYKWVLWAGPKCNSWNTQCSNISSFTPTISQVQIHSLLHIIYYCACSSMGIPQHFWVSWAPNPRTACDPFHEMYFSRLKVQANYSLSLRWLWIGKCWAQLVSDQKDWSERWFPSAIKRGHSDLNLFEACKNILL